MTKTRFPKDVKPVLVEWIDSAVTGGWNSKEAYKNPSDYSCVTVGILLNKTKDRIIIALNQSAHQYGEIIEIPLVAVKRIRKLRYV